MKTQNDAGQQGFSLTELLVALAMTLIVAGAIFALLTGGQNAFRREPEYTERQQNIRVAMDVIMRDVASAGTGMPTFLQTFTQGLNADGPQGPNNLNADDLEMLTNPLGLEQEPACHYADNSANLNLYRNRTSVAPGSIFLVFLENGKFTMRQASNVQTNNSAAGSCDVVKDDMKQINFSPGDNQDLNASGGICAGGSFGTTGGDPECRVASVGYAELVGYRVRVTGGVPNLERRSSGSVSGSWGTESGWQIVARGVEDMQVQYERPTSPTNATLGWFDDPGTVRCDPGNADAQCCDPLCAPPLCTPSVGCTPPAAEGWNTLVRQVRVTLTSRSEAERIQGMTKAATSGYRAAIRGDLTSTGAVRTVLVALTRENVAPANLKWQ